MQELISIPLNINSYINSSIQELVLDYIPKVETELNSSLIPSIDSLNVDNLLGSIQGKLLNKLKEQVSNVDVISKLESNFDKIKSSLDKLSILCSKIQNQLKKYRSKIEKIINKVNKFLEFLNKIFNPKILKIINTGLTIANIVITFQPTPLHVKEPFNTIIGILKSILSMFSSMAIIVQKFISKLQAAKDKILGFIDKIEQQIIDKCKKITEALDLLLNTALDYIKNNYPEEQINDASTEQAIKTQDISKFTERLNKGLNNMEIIYRFTNNMEVFSYEVKKI